MLRECKEHGYYRGFKCPVCNKEGRFLMNDDELDKVGRMLAGILRHFPERFNLELDEHGWINMNTLLDAIRYKRRQFRWLRLHHIRAVVKTDPKGRYQIDGDMVRATYGHSIKLDLDLPTDNIPDKLYYPTSQEEADIVLETGLKPADRRHVHLSRTVLDAKSAGLHRVDDPIILEVDAKKAIKDGIIIKQAGTTVYLTDEVPPEYLKKLEES